jgi:hypothetical protein
VVKLMSPAAVLALEAVRRAPGWRRPPYRLAHPGTPLDADGAAAHA